MCVKIKKRFLSPLSRRFTEIDSEINVPKNQFWFRRIDNKDCVEIVMKPKSKTGLKKPVSSVNKSSKKGSN